MTERKADPLDYIGDVLLDTPQLRKTLEKTGEPLGMAGVRAFDIDAAIDTILDGTERGLQDLARHNGLYGGPRHGAALAVLGGSPLRKPGDFKFLVAQVVARRLTEAGIPVREPDVGDKWPSVRAAVDKTRGLALLRLTENWRSASPDVAEPDEAA